MTRLTLDQIPSLRAQSDPMSDQIAGFVTSDWFKSSFNSIKARSMPLSRFFSKESRDFTGSALKKTANKPVKTRLIPLGTGRPGAELYPWRALTADTTCLPAHRTSTLNGVASGPVLQHHSQPINQYGPGFNLARAFNYGHAAGSQPLVRFFTEHIELVHNPPYQNWSTCLTGGSTSALEIVLRIFCNRGDPILTERYTYPGTLETAQLLGLRPLGIDMDPQGLVPAHLEQVLRSWDPATSGPRPSVLYTIPSGQNPTGATQSVERKMEIYRLAEVFDLVVIEDDPYYFLRMDWGSRSRAGLEEQDCWSDAAATSFLASLPPSYLSLDRSGRVVRLDSTSKILAPGLRAGWITACDEVIDKFISYTEVSTVAVSGPSQVLLWQLLESTWGHGGFSCWLQQLSAVYQSRLAALLNACQEHLPNDVCSWVPPENGMFLWIALDLTKHPAYVENSWEQSSSTLSILVETRIFANALRDGLLITKGSLFDTRKVAEDVVYIRVTNAAAKVEEFDGAIRILSNVIKEEFALPAN